MLGTPPVLDRAQLVYAVDAGGTYHLLACVNDDHPVAETTAGGNCMAAANRFTIVSG